MFTPIKSLPLLLVIISSMSLPVCNRFHATRASSGKITTFRGVAVFDGLLEPRGSGLELLKSTFNAENFI